MATELISCLDCILIVLTLTMHQADSVVKLLYYCELAAGGATGWTGIDIDGSGTTVPDGLTYGVATGVAAGVAVGTGVGVAVGTAVGALVGVTVTVDAGAKLTFSTVMLPPVIWKEISRRGESPGLTAGTVKHSVDDFTTGSNTLPSKFISLSERRS